MTQWLPLLCVMLSVGCSAAPSECDLAAGLTARSGGGATNCGHADLGADASPVDACVIAAFEKGIPFVAQYDRMGDRFESGARHRGRRQRTSDVPSLGQRSQRRRARGLGDHRQSLCRALGRFVIDERSFQNLSPDVHVGYLTGSHVRVIRLVLPNVSRARPCYKRTPTCSS